jgi:hypothetical protein
MSTETKTAADAAVRTKVLGKIAYARFGWGGHENAMLGLSISFSMKGTGVGTFDGAWGIEWSEQVKWTEESRLTSLGKVTMRLGALLKMINKLDAKDLVGTPVELTFDGTRLVEWRILEEVL